jgi:peptidoglycan hydrolase-like protein with peptidoglycan-binding domain
MIIRPITLGIFLTILLLTVGYAYISIKYPSLSPTAVLQTAPGNYPHQSQYEISHNLKIGDRGESVKILQEFLNKDGYMIATSGPNSQGQETGVFDQSTANALSKYQAD